MPDADGGRVAQATAVARRILDAEGWEAVTMRRVADEMGIRAPSLYKHLADKDELRVALVAEAIAELGAALADAGADLSALASAYRSWALSRPHRYRLATEGSLDRSRLPEGLEDRAAHPLWLASGGDEHRARAIWAAAHGLAILEIDHRFPQGADVDAAWRAMVSAFANG
jgi:AcrR family transcriptional regulator